MALIVYTPTFQHEAWVDNVDRVQAGGDNGFNIRFHTIEAEFQQLSQVMQTIDTALINLGEQVSAPITIGLTPVLLAFGGNPQWSAISWSRTSGGQPLGTFVEKPTAADQAWGVMPLNLPNSVRLINIRVLGDQSGAGDVKTELFQESRIPPFDRLSLVAIPGLGGPTTQPTPIPGSVTFDGASNLYYLLINVTNAANITVRLRGFQITYQP